MEYSHIIYQENQENKRNKIFSSIIALKPPLTIISFCFTPFLFYFESRYTKNYILIRSLNYYLQIFCYFIVFSIPFTIFNVISLGILIPLSFLKILILILFNKYCQLNKTKSKGILSFSFGIRIVHFFLWIICGIPYLLYIHFINDFPLFLKSIFYYIENREKLTEITSIDYKYLKKCTYYFLEKKNETFEKMEEKLKKVSKEEKSSLDLKESTKHFYNCDIEKFKNKFFLCLEYWREIEEKSENNELNELNEKIIKPLHINKFFTDISYNDEIKWKNIKLEKLEAHNFIFSNFSYENQINLENLNMIFKNLQFGKTKKVLRKKYPETLKIINISDTYDAIQEFQKENFK